MATIEILSGDFRRETTRIRYSEAGRAYLRLTSVDGRAEDLFLESEVVGAAAAGDGKVGDYLRRWAERDGFTPGDAAAEARDRHVFVVLLRDGRKFVASGSFEALALVKTASLPVDLRREMCARLDAARAHAKRAVPSFAAWLVPGLLARFLPGGRRATAK